ncbi:MAG: carboxylating nicotinate-nucleotide diphosphorylase [Gemmatimonadota bacterium]
MADATALNDLISLALAEDVGSGDWTTEWTVAPGAFGIAVIVAKAPLVVAGTRAACRVFQQVEPRLEVTLEAEDGDRLPPGGQLIRVRGPLRGILTGERVALNFLGRLSGVATLTRRYVDAVKGTGARILDTRKTTPGWRVLEKEAVRAGGGYNHRMGLHDMILVKDNHLVAAGGVKAAVEGILKENSAGFLVEVEVTTLQELDELLPLGVDRILLDNMDRETMREAVGRVKALGEVRPMVEASGNMDLETVRGVAETGVDFISVGALTHSAPGADLSLRVLMR